MNSLPHLLTLQPCSAAANQQPVPSPQKCESPAAAELTPLAKAQLARGYQSAYFLLRDLAALRAHQLSMEGWQLLMRAKDYCGLRYNQITLGGTEFAPPEWRSR